MTAELQSLIAKSVTLASLPETVTRTRTLINSSASSATEIGDSLSHDPALTARLLRIVNSPYYGFATQIETVSRAITLIGTLDLLDLVLATSVVRLFKDIPPELVTMEKFWEHSLYTAVIARILAQHGRAPNTERYFIAGLIHDIGELVLFSRRPRQSAEVLRLVQEKSGELLAVETQVFGFTHSQVGAELARAWNLPPSLVTAIRYHHAPADTDSFQLETAIVHCADAIGISVKSALPERDAAAGLSAEAWDLLGIPLDDIETLIDRADTEFADIRDAILPNANAA
jgi:putative nucleotidyltransferase with HDIG domain